MSDGWGKGDRRRPYNRQAWESGYDRIFGKKCKRQGGTARLRAEKQDRPDAPLSPVEEPHDLPNP